MRQPEGFLRTQRRVLKNPETPFLRTPKKVLKNPQKKFPTLFLGLLVAGFGGVCVCVLGGVLFVRGGPVFGFEGAMGIDAQSIATLTSCVSWVLHNLVAQGS